LTKLRWFVANGVTRFDEGFAVFGEQHAVAGFFDIVHEHGLLGVTRDGDVERALGFGVAGTRAEGR